MARVSWFVCAFVALVGCAHDVDEDGVKAKTDCNDRDAEINPGLPEVCDGKDNDCDGLVDEPDAEDAQLWYADVDTDGHGDPATELAACVQPPGYVADGLDCDDTSAAAHPGAAEYCDGADNDCDGETDEDDAIDAPTWYGDADHDGYGADDTTTRSCAQPPGQADVGGDCDDGDDAVNPAAAESCNGEDDDCDGVTDEPDAVDAPTWYADADADGYGDVWTPLVQCDQRPGYVLDSTDCDDEADTAYPGGTEMCDGHDNDCDPRTSEAGTVTVDGSPGSTFSTLFEALQVAGTGSDIAVCEGTWNEQIDLSYDDMTLWGPNGPDVTVLDGTGLVGSILQPHATATVMGLTFRSGASSFVAGAIDGYSYDGGPLHIEDCAFEGNTAEFGGAVIGPASYSLTLVDAVFEGNTGGIGGAVYAWNADLTGSRFLNNDADVGGALMVAGTITADAGTSFVSNHATAGGGALYVEGGSLTGGVCQNNIADRYGGCGYVYYGSVTDLVVQDNIAGSSGGGLYGGGGEISLTGLTLSGNASTGDGGALAFDSATAEIDSCILDGNDADRGGGILVDQRSTVYVVDSSVTSNTATVGGGALVEGELESDNVDWGTSSTENDPDDVYVGDGDTWTSYTSYSTASSFTCSGSDASCN